jgi:hypothetical protein
MGKDKETFFYDRLTDYAVDAVMTVLNLDFVNNADTADALADAIQPIIKNIIEYTPEEETNDEG